jgi:hypothetical protein
MWPCVGYIPTPAVGEALVPTMPDDDLSLTALRVLAQLAYGQTQEPLRTRAQRDLQRRLVQLKEIRDNPDIPPKLRRHAENTLKELG